MTSEELYETLLTIQKMRCETQTLELKSAEYGCPKRLYDTLSSFSNQDDGGMIVFGIDEEKNYKETGVYDTQDIQKKINEQCLQMTPVVRPLITVVEKDGKKDGSGGPAMLLSGKRAAEGFLYPHRRQ